MLKISLFTRDDSTTETEPHPAIGPGLPPFRADKSDERVLMRGLPNAETGLSPSAAPVTQSRFRNAFDLWIPQKADDGLPSTSKADPILITSRPIHPDS